MNVKHLPLLTIIQMKKFIGNVIWLSFIYKKIESTCNSCMYVYVLLGSVGVFFEVRARY
jgi:hypothetical protein